MSHLHSGTWIGLAVNQINGNSEKFFMEIKVGDNGSFTGTIQSEHTRSQELSKVADVEGRYSPYGSLHLRYTVDDSRYALFDGRFETPDERSGVIWGSMSLISGDKVVPAVASLHFTTALASQRNGHVWDK